MAASRLNSMQDDPDVLHLAHALEVGIGLVRDEAVQDGQRHRGNHRVARDARVAGADLRHSSVVDLDGLDAHAVCSSTFGRARSHSTRGSTRVAVPDSRQPNISRSSMLRRDEATPQMRCQIHAADIWSW